MNTRTVSSALSQATIGSPSNALQRLLATDAGYAPLALRIPIGIIFVAHGAQKSCSAPSAATVSKARASSWLRWASRPAT